MKAQMFMVTIILLSGIVFFVYRGMVSYSNVRMDVSYEESYELLLNDTYSTINETIINANYCNFSENSFENAMEELVNFFKKSYADYSINIYYKLNCSRWENPPGSGEPPLEVRVEVYKNNLKIEGERDFFHKR